MAKVQVNGFGMNAELEASLLPLDTLFIHGNLASNRWWQPALEIWKRRSHPGLEGRGIFAEWRGCGQSDSPHSASQLEMQNLADDYIALMQSLGIKKACVVGHSTGGLIALYAMLKAPELFDRAVLLDPVSASGVELDPTLLDAFTKMSHDRAFCSAVMNGTIHGNNPESVFFQGIVDDAMSVAEPNWHGVPQALRKADISSRLGEIRQPILVLHGEHDQILPIAESRAMAKGLANSRFLELKEQGHSTNVENPELFINLVNEFLFKR